MVQVFGHPQRIVFNHQHPARYQGQRPGHDQTVEVDLADVHLSIAIGVFQHGDTPNGFIFTFALNFWHKPPHLNNPQPIGLIEGDHNGVLHHWLSGNELHFQAGFELKCR